jgi:hypothetical protein
MLPNQPQSNIGSNVELPVVQPHIKKAMQALKTHVSESETVVALQKDKLITEAKPRG